MDTPTTDEVLEVLKGLLREQGVTYAELAPRIGMSESGVKKIFSADDASLSRLLSICSSLEIELEEVIALARRGPLPLFKPNAEQQAAFRKWPQSLWFLWGLHASDGVVAEVRKKLGLDARSTRVHLARLERLELIEAGAEGHMKMPTRGRGWSLGRELAGPVMDPMHDAVLASARRHKRCMDKSDPDAELVDLAMARLELRRETAIELHAALHAVLDEFSLRSRREKALWPQQERHPVGVMTALAPFALADLFTDG